MSLAHELCWGSVEAIVSRLALKEVPGTDTVEYQVLISPMMPEPVGAVRVFQGELGCVLVYVGMTVPMIGLDSHMMFAFMPPTSAVPHFTVDSVQNGEDFAFHLDLIPRVDLGAHLAYMDHVFTPLTDARETALALEGLTPAHLAPRQWALMSEWMMANRADESAFLEIGSTVAQYLDHWFALVEHGIAPELLEGVDAERLQARDAANRAAIFNPDVDRVWANVERLLGAETSESVRLLLESGGALAVAASETRNSG